MVANSLAAPKVLRDYHKLLGLIKATTLIRHQHRTRDAAGRLVADPEDYEAVFTLLKPVYGQEVLGVPDSTRRVVAAVRTHVLGPP